MCCIINSSLRKQLDLNWLHKEITSLVRQLQKIASLFKRQRNLEILKWKWKWSCVQLFAAPWTVSYQAPLSLGFSRQEYWSGLLFPSPGKYFSLDWSPFPHGHILWLLSKRSLHRFSYGLNCLFAPSRSFSCLFWHYTLGACRTNCCLCFCGSLEHPCLDKNEPFLCDY